MKLKLFLSAALIAGVISAQAASVNAVSAAMPATAATNSTDDAMKALFGDPVVAQGTGFKIKRSDMDDLLAGAKSKAAVQNQTLPPDFDLSVLNQLITIQMLLQKATPADRAAGKTEADAQYQKFLKYFGSPEALERQLKASGMTLEALQAKAAQDATAMATLKRELNINVTDAEVKAYYTAHSADFEEPEKAHVRHILLMTIDPATHSQLSSNTIAFKRKQIDDILKRAKSGQDFAELAKKYSEDPGSKDNGGDLPEFARGQMMPEFEAGAFALNKGQISDVVTTVYGYHIIKMEDKIPAKKYGFDDMIPNMNETPAAICKQELEAQKIKELAPAYVKKLRTEMKVEIVDPSLKARDEKLEADSDAAAAVADPIK